MLLIIEKSWDNRLFAKHKSYFCGLCKLTFATLRQLKWIPNSNRLIWSNIQKHLNILRTLQPLNGGLPIESIRTLTSFSNKSI